MLYFLSQNYLGVSDGSSGLDGSRKGKYSTPQTRTEALKKTICSDTASARGQIFTADGGEEEEEEKRFGQEMRHPSAAGPSLLSMPAGGNTSQAFGDSGDSLLKKKHRSRREPAYKTNEELAFSLFLKLYEPVHISVQQLVDARALKGEVSAAELEGFIAARNFNILQIIRSDRGNLVYSAFSEYVLLARDIVHHAITKDFFQDTKRVLEIYTDLDKDRVVNSFLLMCFPEYQIFINSLYNIYSREMGPGAKNNTSNAKAMQVSYERRMTTLAPLPVLVDMRWEQRDDDDEDGDGDEAEEMIRITDFRRLVFYFKEFDVRNTSFGGVDHYIQPTLKKRTVGLWRFEQILLQNVFRIRQ